MRPVMAFRDCSGSPVTPAKTRMGFPTPPQATGAVLASRQSTAAWNGGNPRADEKGTGNRHRSSASACAFKERSKAECNQNRLQARIGGEGSNRFLHHLELAGFHGNVVEENGGNDDPRNPDQSKHNSQEGGVGNKEGRHPKNRLRPEPQP